MSSTKDPLEGLLLDADEVDRTTVAAVLRDLLGVDSKTGRVVLKPGFSRVTARQKMVAYLLGRKAAKLLGKTESEAATVKDVQADTGLPRGTIAPKLRELLKAKTISQVESGEYYVGPQQVGQAISELRREAKE